MEFWIRALCGREWITRVTIAGSLTEAVVWFAGVYGPISELTIKKK